MKGYLTVFLSMMLAILSGVILSLTMQAIRNGSRVRFECIADSSMNSALAEYEKTLQDRYGLFYVDLSYLGETPSVENLESRLRFYMQENLKDTEKNVWGKLLLKDTTVQDIGTAAAGNGASMKRQAISYVQECGLTDQAAVTAGQISKVAGLLAADPFAEWSSLMEMIGAMELPQIQNEDGEWEEVPLSNPADHSYSLTGCDLLFLLQLPVMEIPVSKIRQGDYLSGRGNSTAACGSSVKRVREMAVTGEASDALFQTYLYHKMGSFHEPKSDGLLQYQLEYIAEGYGSDYENLQAVAEELLRIRFAVNAKAALQDGGLYAEALAIAGALTAVTLSPEFLEPVTRSILYACAYLESLGEVCALLQGGYVEDGSGTWHIRPSEITEVSQAVSAADGSGMNYEMYLACLIRLKEDRVRSFRAMDIMEMDIRYLTGNENFCMDWCAEWFLADITGSGIMGARYGVNRLYGYDA